MGFFSDLKEDLSQAVSELNELVPEEEQAVASEEPAEEQPTEEQPAEEQQPDDAETVISLDEMLEKLDEIQLPEETVSEEAPAEEQELAEDLENVEAQDLAEPEDVTLMDILATKDEPEEAAQEETAEDAEMAELLEQMLEESPLEEKSEEIAEDKQEEAMEDKNETSKGAEKKMEIETTRVAVDETSVITEGMMITGDIVTEGSIDVIGTVTGNIDALGKLNITGHINGNSKAAEIYAEGAKINGEVVSEGAVKIGASSVVIGNITATSAAIAGAVKGDIDVRGPVILDASAIVMGNIKSKSVQINNGAVIEGMCSQCYAEVNPISFFDDYKPEVRKGKSK